MALVPDASVILCLAFQDEGLEYGGKVLEAIAEQGARVPSIFWYEMRNAPLVSERRKRITPAQSSAFLALVGELPISIEPLPVETGVLDLARRHKLSVYDAAYLELALREDLPLATLDGSLAKVAKKCRVVLWDKRE